MNIILINDKKITFNELVERYKIDECFYKSI